MEPAFVAYKHLHHALHIFDGDLIVTEQHGNDLADQHIAAGRLTGVALIAHQHTLCQNIADVDAAILLQDMVHDGGEKVLDLQQIALDLRVPHSPCAQAVAALKGDAVRFIAMSHVFHYVDHHVVGHDAGSRADGIVVVTGGQLDLAGSDHRVGLLHSLGQAGMDGTVADAALLHADHVVPVDWRTGMHDHIFFEAGDRLNGLFQTDPVALRLVEGLDRFCIGLVDLLLQAGVDGADHPAELCVNRRLPGQVDGLVALVLDALGKGLDANIDHRRFLLKHFIFHGCSSFQETIRPANSAAFALLGCRITPYFFRRSACSATFWGSISVPQREAMTQI